MTWKACSPNPPEATKPRCYWYWMDGHITKEGITKDLEAMRRFGIGEGYIGIISGQSGMARNRSPRRSRTSGGASSSTPMREGGRSGVDIGFFNSPGWSQSGGPWVQPEQAMRYVALPETRLRGPQQFEGKLPTPEGAFQDIAVLAFPAARRAKTSAAPENRAHADARSTFEMPAPFTARSITVHPVESRERHRGVAGFRTMVKQYRTVKTFAVDRHNLEYQRRPGAARAGRGVVSGNHGAVLSAGLFGGRAKLGDIRLLAAARVESLRGKVPAEDVPGSAAAL